jgi:hypothetical protein
MMGRRGSLISVEPAQHAYLLVVLGFSLCSRRWWEVGMVMNSMLGEYLGFHRRA